MINNIWFKIIAWKINKIPEFYTIFAHKMPDYIITQRDRGQAEAKTSRPRPVLWGRGQNFGLEANGLNVIAVICDLSDRLVGFGRMIARAYDLATRGRPKVEIPLSAETVYEYIPYIDVS